MNTFLKRNLITGLCLTALVAPVWAAQPAITVQLEPQRIALGESAQLVVTVNGSDAAQSPVPQVDGLEIVPVGQQTSMEMINGNVTSNVSQIFRVIPNRAGDFTIPAIGGSTQPMTLHVDKRTGSQTQRAMPLGRSRLPAPSFSQPADSEPVDTKNRFAFLRVVLPKQELTVGELVPVQVKAYFRAGVSASLNGLPVLSSDAFTLNKLDDKPEQSRESINGVPYTVVTWTSALSAVKAGDYPLNLDLPVMVRVQEQGKRGGGRDPFKDAFGEDSPFGDAFFDDFFGHAIEKPLTLHTDGVAVKIKPLPTNGRPADFSGAVGQFEVMSEASTTNATTGDPLMLKLSITGRGNFDRVSTNGLKGSSNWKSYKPNGRFEPADSSGTAGTKTFEQSIVPTKAGSGEIPALHFGYFDPNTQAYVTKTTAPIAIQIAQGSATQAPATNVQAPAADVPKPNADGLAADKIATGQSVRSLRPLVLAPWFLTLNALMVATVVVGGLVRYLGRRRMSDPQRLQREATERSVNESLVAMDAALKAQDATRFFAAARRALQQRLAAQWQIPASRVTILEIRSRLNGSGEQIRSVFQTADEIAYSGRRFTTPDLQDWRYIIKTQLQKFGPS
jgi:hypothetical protein